MAANTFLGGTLNFKINGQAYQVAGSFSEMVGGQIRKAKSSTSGVVGFTQTYAAPAVDCELIDDGTVSSATLKSITNSTLTIAYDNGMQVVLSNAWQEDEITKNAVEATMKVKFCGLTRTEVPA